MMVAAAHETSDERYSHEGFFLARNWDSIEKVWKKLLKSHSSGDLPAIFQGYQNGDPYGMTDIDAINASGQREFTSGNPKFRRTTLAFSIGYLGSAYSGYQQQRGVDGIVTVEDDLDALLGRKVVAAGRTDKGVSALSQVVSFATYDPIDENQLLVTMRNSEPCLSGRLAVWNCKRVPRKFHPLFGAKWRRYLYLFPLNTGPFQPSNVDVDVEFINRAFSRIEGRELPFNGFAHRENRATEDGHGDLCTLFRAKATVIDAVEIWSAEESSPATEKFLCIELVGDRFLRRMVRILVGTVVRESVLPIDTRNESILHEVAVTRNRNRASAAAPGDGLALCGVGYDLEDLADMNGSKKVNTTKKQSTSNEGAGGQSISVSSSRRKRKQEEQENSSNVLGFRRFTPSFSNTAKLDVGCDSNIVLTKGDDAFISRFADELIVYDPDLLYQPERAFSFSHGELHPQMSIVLPQSCADVGTTIWDAETLLAHYAFDRYLQDKTTTKRVLELGAGTALAALTWQRSSASDVVVVQELPEVAVSLQQSLLQQAGGSSIACVGGVWGNEFLNHPIISEAKFDIIMMADVFYHEEHFGELLATTIGALNVGGDVIAVFEQRRKDLSAVVQQFASYAFQRKSVVQFDVSRRVLTEDSGESFPTMTTFYVCHFQGFAA